MRIILGLLIVTLAGCSFEVVPPAHKGKILTTAGYMPDLVDPGKLTLFGRDQLVLLQTATVTTQEPMIVIMRDKLKLGFDVRFRGRIAGNPKVIHAMFNDITPDKENQVTYSMVYDVYGKMLVRNQARAVMSEYSVEDVHTNYKRISAEIAEALYAAFESTPLEVSDVALGNIAYPKVITEAVEQAKQRELQIRREQAQAEIDLTKKENEKRLAEADYEIGMIKARQIRDQNKLIADGVTAELLEYRKWEVVERLQDNQNVVFMPIEGMASTGAQVRMYGAR